MRFFRIAGTVLNMRTGATPAGESLACWTAAPPANEAHGGCAPPRNFARVLLGDAGAAERPRMERGEHALVADRVREVAARPRLVCDPVHLAVRLGVAVVDRAPIGVGGEVADERSIFYRWHPSPRVRGVRVAHGLAHAVLASWRWEHGEADAWCVTAHLLWPAELARRVQSVAAALRVQPHAPRWLLEAQTKAVLEGQR